MEDSDTSSGEEAPSPVLREKTRRKRNGLQEYPEHLFDNNVVRERRQTYVSSDNYERVRTLLSVIAPTVSISCYIDNILSAHLEQYRDEPERHLQQPYQPEAVMMSRSHEKRDTRQ